MKNNYFNIKHDSLNRFLFLMAQLFFLIGSLINYYYIDTENIKLRSIFLLFNEFFGSLCMTIFQYRCHWLRGTIIMLGATLIITLILIDVIILYFKNKK